MPFWGGPNKAATAAAAAAADKEAKEAADRALFAASGDNGKYLRVRYKFDKEVVDKAIIALTDFQYVTIPFPVEESAADLDAATEIGGYINTGKTPTATSETSATDAARIVTKDNLLDVLLRQARIGVLKTELEAVNFNTRVGDSVGPPYAPGTGMLNLSADTKPYTGTTGDARFKALLSCFYGDKMVQPCVRENKAVYAHMHYSGPPNDVCKNALIAAIINDFPPGDEQCALLAAATNKQVPPVVGGGRRNATRRKAKRNQKARRRTR